MVVLHEFLAGEGEVGSGEDAASVDCDDRACDVACALGCGEEASVGDI